MTETSKDMAYNFRVKQSLSLENSFGTIKKEHDVLLDVTVGIFKSQDSGWFELYDVESFGDEWYAEGSLSFEDMRVTEYDGVFGLPTCIIDKLKELGYDTSEVE
jgi:hypothetical protein